MEDTHGQKTESPTPKRLKDARERGQVASSRDLPMAVGTLAAAGAFAMTGTMLMHRLTEAIARSFSTMGEAAHLDLDTAALVPLVASGLTLLAWTAGPIALAAAAAGAMTALTLNGFSVSTKAMSIRWERLSPRNGLAKLAPARSGVDALKATLIAAAIGALAWNVGSELAAVSLQLPWSSPERAADHAWNGGSRLLWRVGLVLVVFGAADYALQRWRHWSSLKMTRHEVRDELKTTEGSPEVKARIRRIQFGMARRRMLQAVPRATVVLTNPTHYAVALEYRRENGSAPVVVAKGRDRMAGRIRDLAARHGVPIVENPPLARALYADCEVGDAIPGALFGAVAEVLAYLIRIKQLVL